MAIQRVDIRQEGPRVHLVVSGRLVGDWTPEMAREVAAALNHQAGRAEEILERERIVFDQAILLRLGAPLGLLHDPHLRAEAGREAAWNSRLRRYLPGGVRSAEAFGVPTIIRHAPPATAPQEAS